MPYGIQIRTQSDTTMKIVSQTLPRITATAMVSFCLSGVPAKATLFQATDTAFGPNSLTVDTSTGLAWLDLTASTGLSYQQMTADLQPGGLYSGFRYATDQEVLALYASAGLTTGFFPASSQPIASFLSLLGATTSQYGQWETLGISGTGSSGGLLVPGIEYYLVNGVGTYEVTGNPNSTLIYGATTGEPTVGNWLVQDVPETASPSVYVLAAAGLIGFSLLQRREKNRQPGA